MEIVVLIIFCALLLTSVLTGISMVLALLAGLVLFLVYGHLKGFGARALAKMCADGVLTAKNILLTFLFIGMLTAVWRASGCIPAIVCYASGLIRPSIFIVLTFLLCTLVSFLTGTSFGTVATMGVICMSVANSMGLSPFWVGGAILSGIYYGDRCSPVSTSALLVATLTETSIYDNIRSMVRSAAVPFAAACGVYLVSGFLSAGSGGSLDVISLFQTEFVISPLCVIPVICVLVPACFRLNVRTTLCISIASALPVALLVQRAEPLPLLKSLLLGFHAANPELSGLIDGGGISSMVKVGAIVCIASCYSGIFEATGLLSFLQSFILRFAKRFGNYRAVLLVSIPATCIACNQTLGTMLTHQLTTDLDIAKEDRALYLEDSSILVAALVPWCIACNVPIATIGAPLASILGAVYIWFIPLWQLIRNGGPSRAGKQ